METIVDTHDDDPLEELGRITEARRVLRASEEIAVRRARTSGYSWAEIGSILGVSKQAMHRKFGRHT